ncbi:hypothetical protein [Candidatus Palauibacter sp.]|uniref:hypothetical protein n=1 Tax=Candidatus Palauibacter sp. TaxID=3101350 RepID=UPI003AF2EB5B
MNETRHTRWIQAVLMITVVISVGLLVRVAQGKQAAEEREQRLFDRTQNPRAGIHVPIYEATSSAGEAVRLGQPEPGTRQVLLFFNTTCPYCLNSVPTWNALTDLADSRDDVTAIGVALDPRQA